MAEILKPDLCIIGASAAGTRLAMRAREYGAAVMLIERGGDGAERETVGFAALGAAAARAQLLRSAAPFGMTNDEPRPNFRAVRDHVQAVITASKPAFDSDRLAALGIDMRSGPAAFTDRRTLKLDDVLVRARRFVLATGARLPEPDIKGLDQVPVFTPQSILDNGKKLSHLVILGRTPEALELAQAYRRLGSDVTVVAAAALLDMSDQELAELVLRRLREEGVVIHDSTSVTEVVARGQGIGINIMHADGRAEALDASHILVAPPAMADFAGLDLDKANIRHDKSNGDRLSLTTGLRTSNGHVFAIGAAANAGQLHAGLAQADIVLDNALFGLSRRYRSDQVPQVLLTDPGLATIGLSEVEARARHKTNYSVLRANFSENDMARAERETQGLVKLVLGMRGEILGASVLGARAAELIAFFAFAMARGMTAADLNGFVAPHPALAGIVAQLGQAYAATRGPDAGRRRRMALARFLP